MARLPRMPGSVLMKRLHQEYHFTEDHSLDLMKQAAVDGHALHGNPAGRGYIDIIYHGKSSFSIEEIIRNFPSGVAPTRRVDYTKRNDKPRRVTSRRANQMPPRGRKAAAAEVAPEPEVDETDPLLKHLTKDLSATMEDYVDWLEQEYPELLKEGWDRIAVFAVYAYPTFQKSDFNIERRSARKAERAASAPAAEEPEPETEAPARRGRKAAAPAKAAAKPAPPRRGKAAAATAAPY